MPLMLATLSCSLTGGVIRVLLDRLLRRLPATSHAHIISELLLGVALGLVMTVPALLLVSDHGAGTAIVLAGLTTYAAASAGFASRRGAVAWYDQRRPVLVHFAGAYVSTLVGFVAAAALLKFFL